VPISISLGDQTGRLENPQRLFVMFVEEVAQIGRHGTISPRTIGLGARFVERWTSVEGAGVTPWSSKMVATPCSRVALVNVASRSALVRVASKLACASVLDESERQVFGVVEVIQECGVVRGAERGISRSLEGSHEDGLQNVFDGEVTNVAHCVVELGDRSEMMVDCALGVSIPANHASNFTSKQNSLHARVVQRESSKKGFPYLLGTERLGSAVGVETCIESVSGAQRS
jgi:hypothetical protein